MSPPAWMQSIRARRTRGGTSRDAIRASMRGDDVVVDFDSNDVPYYALAGALADARARWMATIVFRLACAFWFACGCAFGRAFGGFGCALVVVLVVLVAAGRAEASA